MDNPGDVAGPLDAAPDPADPVDPVSPQEALVEAAKDALAKFREAHADFPTALAAAGDAGRALFTDEQILEFSRRLRVNNLPESSADFAAHVGDSPPLLWLAVALRAARETLLGSGGNLSSIMGQVARQVDVALAAARVDDVWVFDPTTSSEHYILRVGPTGIVGVAVVDDDRGFGLALAREGCLQKTIMVPERVAEGADRLVDLSPSGRFLAILSPGDLVVVCVDVRRRSVAFVGDVEPSCNRVAVSDDGTVVVMSNDTLTALWQTADADHPGLAADADHPGLAADADHPGLAADADHSGLAADADLWPRWWWGRRGRASRASLLFDGPWASRRVVAGSSFGVFAALGTPGPNLGFRVMVASVDRKRRAVNALFASGPLFVGTGPRSVPPVLAFVGDRVLVAPTEHCDATPAVLVGPQGHQVVTFGSWPGRDPTSPRPLLGVVASPAPNTVVVIVGVRADGGPSLCSPDLQICGFDVHQVEIQADVQAADSAPGSLCATIVSSLAFNRLAAPDQLPIAVAAGSRRLVAQCVCWRQGMPAQMPARVANIVGFEARRRILIMIVASHRRRVPGLPTELWEMVDGFC